MEPMQHRQYCCCALARRLREGKANLGRCCLCLAVGVGVGSEVWALNGRVAAMRRACGATAVTHLARNTLAMGARGAWKGASGRPREPALRSPKSVPMPLTDVARPFTYVSSCVNPRMGLFGLSGRLSHAWGSSPLIPWRRCVWSRNNASLAGSRGRSGDRMQMQLPSACYAVQELVPRP